MQSKTGLFIVLFLIGFSSCKKEKERGILTYEEEKIRQVMLDLYVATAAIDRMDEAIADSLRGVYMSQIETIHDVELFTVEEDIMTIKQNPEWYHEIHSEVKDSLHAQEKRAKKKNTTLIKDDKDDKISDKMTDKQKSTQKSKS